MQKSGKGNIFSIAAWATILCKTFTKWYLKYIDVYVAAEPTGS